MDDRALELPAAPPPRTEKAALRKASTDSPIAGFFFDLLVVIGALLLLSVVCGVVWAVVVGVQIAAQTGPAFNADDLMQALLEPDPILLIWMTLISTGGAALLVYFWRRRATTDEITRSTQAILKPTTWGWILAAATTTFLFSAAITGVAQYLGMAPEPSNVAVIQAAFASQPLFLMVFAILIAPAYEELLFRRVLFGRLWAAGRPWLGLVLSSTAFALMHEFPGANGNSWQATIVLWLTYGFMGAVFAAVYWRTRTLWAAYAAHALNNAVALTVMKLYGGG